MCGWNVWLDLETQDQELHPPSTEAARHPIHLGFLV